jgi:hypothetical protein
VVNDAAEFALWLSPHILANTGRVLATVLKTPEDEVGTSRPTGSTASGTGTAPRSSPGKASSTSIRCWTWARAGSSGTLGGHHDADLAYGALAMAAAVRGGRTAGVVFHSDQGSEYTSARFRIAPRPGVPTCRDAADCPARLSRGVPGDAAPRGLHGGRRGGDGGGFFASLLYAAGVLVRCRRGSIRPEQCGRCSGLFRGVPVHSLGTGRDLRA